MNFDALYKDVLTLRDACIECVLRIFGLPVILLLLIILVVLILLVIKIIESNH